MARFEQERERRQQALQREREQFWAAEKDRRAEMRRKLEGRLESELHAWELRVKDELQRSLRVELGHPEAARVGQGNAASADLQSPTSAFTRTASRPSTAA